MDSLYERVVLRLLVESRIDTFARTITRKIVQLIIQRIEKLDAKKRITIVIKNLDPAHEDFNLKLTVTLKQRGDNRVNVAGSWTPALDELDVNVFFETRNGLFDKTLLSGLQQKLYDTVRHEVEHSAQEKPANMYSDEEEDEDEGALWRDLTRLQDYFLSDREIPAFVAGLYHQAKRTRRPFINVLDDKLAAYERVAVHYNAKNSRKVRRLFQKIRGEWVAYAERRFPNAIVK